VAELKKMVVPDWAAVKVLAAAAVLFVTGPVIAPMKPFTEVTGPEKVVEAMMISSHAIRRICLHVVSRDCQIHRKTPE
jgi:hypothetical protein